MLTILKKLAAVSVFTAILWAGHVTPALAAVCPAGTQASTPDPNPFPALPPDRGGDPNAWFGKMNHVMTNFQTGTQGAANLLLQAGANPSSATMNQLRSTQAAGQRVLDAVSCFPPSNNTQFKTQIKEFVVVTLEALFQSFRQTMGAAATANPQMRENLTVIMSGLLQLMQQVDECTLRGRFDGATANPLFDPQNPFPS